MKVSGKIAIYFFLTLVFQGCAAQYKKNQPQILEESVANTTIVSESPKDAPYDYYDIGQSLGLVSLTEKSFGKNEVIRLYNQDGSIWFEFSLNEDSARETIGRKEDFQPFRFDMDDSYHFVFNYVGQDSRYHHVVVNEDTGSKKFIKKDDAHFKVGTWEQYILGCFAVDFKAADNPLLEAPNGYPVTIGVAEQSTFRPETIEGDWLKVSWSDDKDENQKKNFGWVRWKENNKIIIFLFEMA